MADFQLVDGWIIRENSYLPNEESSKATIFALANGYMGTRGAGEELSPQIPGVKGTYINGIYDTPSGKLTEREFPNMPDWTLIRFNMDGDSFDLNTGEILDYSRELDMRAGVVRRSVRWKSPLGKEVTLETERFLSMDNVHIGVIRYKLTTLQDSQIELHSSIDAAVNNRWAYHFKDFQLKYDGDFTFLQTSTYEPGYTITTAVVHTLDGVSSVERQTNCATDRSIDNIYHFSIRSGESVSLTKWASFRESRFSDGDLEAMCKNDLKVAASAGYESFKTSHIDKWAKLWERSDVVIEGDTAAQMGIRFSVFQLLACGPYHCDRISIPARGLQGQDYYGSIFWDCEIFVLPLFTYTHPDAARNLLSYRYHTLDGARRKAAGMGYKGAYYAWQSQEAGDEQTDLYVFTNPLTGEKIRSYFADEQIHISSDIIYAIKHYYKATGDESFWMDGGAEIAVEVARFFVSRSTYNEEKDRFELLTVLGPDEYHERIDNNAYTNVFAAESIVTALEAVNLLKTRHQESYRKLVSKTGLTDSELSKWKSFVDKLYIPSPDPETGLIPQFDGYFDLEDVSVEETRKRLAHPDLHPGGPLGPYQTTQNIKQADVVMQLYLLRDRYDENTKLINWEYYEKRTSHDSSLSPMAYSLVAADVGMLDWAYKYFIYTSHIDLESYGPHWNLGIHAASLGGAWLDVVHGFCQLNLDLDGVKIAKWPALPSGWNKVEFAFTWHGVPMKYRTDGKSLDIISVGDKDVPVILPDGNDTVKAGGILRRELPM